ncbi:MAG: fucose isomerase, partial [Candidatus Dormiibacterota bacterium]
RLTRDSAGYRMQASRGEFVRFGEAEDEALAAQSSPEWPHAFARLDSPAGVVLSRYGSNHIHAVTGDRMRELEIACAFLGVRWENLEQVG